MLIKILCSYSQNIFSLESQCDSLLPLKDLNSMGAISLLLLVVSNVNPSLISCIINIILTLVMNLYVFLFV
jgi:hypothetical protein